MSVVRLFVVHFASSPVFSNRQRHTCKMWPRKSIEGILVFNSMNADEKWVPMKIEVNTWVTLMPGKCGGHGKDATKHGSSSVDGACKAKVLGFRVNGGSTMVSEVLVQHVYMYRQLDLDPGVPTPTPRGCNYLYPSNFQDWVDPKSILDVICVQHAEVGELSRGIRSHRELLEDSVFFLQCSIHSWIEDIWASRTYSTP